MTRTQRAASYIWSLTARRAAAKAARPSCRLRAPERLEDRTLPAVTLLQDGGGRFVVQFTEDAPGNSDTLLLRVNTGGRLEYGLNGAAFATVPNAFAPGSPPLAAAAVSRIDVLLDGGNDVLDVDGLTDPAVIPTGGIVFAAGAGNDRLDLSHNLDMTLTGSAATAGGRTITFTDLETARLTGGNGDTVLDATAFPGPVTLDGGTGKDTLKGGSGDDVLLGLAGGDLMNGGGGNDQLFSGNAGTTMIGEAGNDSLFGGNGQDQMEGGAGNDQLFGGNGTDSMDGGAGDDIFFGGGGNDTAVGGDGTDRVVGIGDLNWTLTDGTLTGEGTDILLSIEQAQLTGGPKDNTLNAAGFSGDVTLQGGGGNDVLRGGTGHNVFNRPVGEVGNIAIVGGPAGSINDYFLWLQGALTLTSPGGKDSLTFLSPVILDLNLTAGTPQSVDGAGSTVALNGFFEECLGSKFDDTVTAASNTTVKGGSGKDTLVADGKSNVVMSGGADADSLLQTGGTNITLAGDTGLDTLVSTGGTGILINGGPDADSLLQTGGTSITLSGDDGLDTLVSVNGNTITLNGGPDADSLQQTGGTRITLSGDDGLDTLVSINGNTITLNGGPDADSLQQTGGTTITLAGDDGLDTLVSRGGMTITMSGGPDADSLQQIGGTSITMSGDGGLDTLVSINGNTITMSGGPDADSLLSSGGMAITMSGGPDADTLQQIGGTTITLAGDDGLDTLTSLNGSQVTMSGGPDADSLLQQGGTSIQMSGDGGFDSLTSQSGMDIRMSGGPDADTLISTAGTRITLAGDDGDDRLTVKEGTDETVAGGAGNDTYVLAGAALGAAVVDEAAGPAPDLSRDTLDFSGFTGGALNLNLAVTAAQAAAPGLTLTLTDAAGVENVIGTAFADIVTGNGRDNLLVGADLLDPPAGPAPAWNGRWQVVYLDFDTYTDPPDEHVYTQAERDAIQAGLVADYVGPDPTRPWFHFEFTQIKPQPQPANPKPQYAQLNFNQTPIPGDQETGGFAHELDFRNLNQGTGAEDDPSRASIQVNGILGVDGQPPKTTENWIALSEKIAAHELGHLVGLLHQDAYGPVGYGPHAPPGGVSYNPNYPGPAAGFETFDHLMSSPAAVGSDRFNDLRDLYFGEREAVKLAFAESGTVVPEQSAAHGVLDPAQPLALAALAVPNTLGAGALNAGKAFSVAALVVTGEIALKGGASESDFYSLTGRKGDLMNIEVLSYQLTRFGGNFIDSMIRVYDAQRNPVAFNDDLDDAHSPHNIDAAIVDLTLPADGTYYIEVDTFTDADVGQYELFVYRFDAGNPADGGDVFDGAGGNDTLVGGLGNDVLTGGVGADALKGGAGDDTYLNPAVGADAVTEEAGRDTLDFSAAAAGVTVNLELAAGPVQAVSAGNTLSITGTVEIVYGTALADSITGNAADNVLDGRAGNDTIRAGLGNDVVLGGDGNDTLDGDGTPAGTDGRDLLIGGLGSDVLRGLGGDDILIGGRTTYDANLAALDAIMAEWSGTGTYAQRVAHLTGSLGGLNGTTYLIKGTTVLDDNKIGDTLTGGLGLDLFFAFVGDRVMDREAPGETSL